MASRLKSLELHGYKTFASKSRFEFPGQITAIVGPNGSGKSNIADAIRWVLGEQAYSMLRGKRTLDMIYSGSEQRPRASMASASISFYNEDGWLPIEFSEVTITRRAYRSGENEYLLNGQRVRLKEINELLASSGLAERTYTLIGQGLVDTALSLRPEERRRFFEEAAGIGLYRSRRDEALQKLESTNRNMERAHDILSELKPRLGNLARQAEKAREYERLQNDLLNLLQDWYGFHWHTSQQELSEATEFHRTQEIKLNEARAQQQEKEKLTTDLRQRLTETRETLTQLHHESARLHSQLEEYNRRHAVSMEKQHSLLTQTRESEQKIAALEELISDARIQEFDSQNQFDRLFKELEENRVQTDISKKDSDELQAKFNALNLQLQELLRIAEDMQIKKSHIVLESQQNALRLSNLQAEIDAINKENHQNKEKYTATESEVLKVREIIEDKNAILHTAEHELEVAVKTRQSAEDEKRIANDALSELNRETSGLKAQYEVYEQAELTHSGFTTGSKALLEKLSGVGDKKKFRTFLSMIEVEAKYEIAIAAILGENIEGLLVERQEILFEALEQIERSGSVRTVLIPLEALRAQVKGKPENRDGAIPAISVVKTREEIIPVVLALLGNVFIINSFEKGLTYQKSAVNEVFVTLKGEILYPNGIVIAGNEVRVKTISRQREQRETKLRLEQVNKELSSQEKLLKALQEKIQINLKTESDLREQIAEHRQALSMLENDLRTKNSSLEQIRAVMKYQEVRQQENQTQIDLIKGSLDSVKEVTKENDIAYAAFQEKIQKQRDLISEIPLDAVRQKWIVASTALAVSEEAIRNAESRLLDKKSARQKLEQDSAEEQKRFNLLQASMNNEKEIFENLVKDIEDSDIAAKALSERIDPLEHNLDNASDHQNSLMLEIDELRKAYNLQERHTLQAQLRMTRLRENLDDLRKHIEEDLGLIAYEYEGDVSGPKPLPIDGWVAALQKQTELRPDLEDQIKQKKGMLRRLGLINPEANKEFQEVSERTVLMDEQLKDLEKADIDLRKVVTELDELMTMEFRKTFKAVEIEFKQIFSQLFGGGSAQLIINNEENITETGIEIEATLPGRRKQELALLSGGERSLTAVALIFALLKISPTPFCVLDEVDAMLDESNVMRFGQLMRSLSEKTQFVVITHNRNTVQLADVLYGITMGRDSTSQVISLRMDELTEEYVR